MENKNNEIQWHSTPDHINVDDHFFAVVKDWQGNTSVQIVVCSEIYNRTNGTVRSYCGMGDDRPTEEEDIVAFSNAIIMPTMPKL